MRFGNPRLSQRGIRQVYASALSLLCGFTTACFGQSPPNDHFTNAIPLYGNSVTFSGSFSNATYEAGESACTASSCFGASGAGSLWWQWTATNSTPVVIDELSLTYSPSGQLGPTGFSVHEATNVSQVIPGSELDWSYMEGFGSFYRPGFRYLAFNAIQGKTYHIRVFGSPLAAFALRLTATNAPVILRSPRNQTRPASFSAVFDVIAGGPPPLNYQWQFEGTPLSGETRPILHLRGLTANQAGNYSVVVSNSSGAITSSVAHLAVSPSDARAVLAPVATNDPNRFYFSIIGIPYVIYRVESSTNLVDWIWDLSAQPVLWTETNLLCYIPKTSEPKFLRAYLQAETISLFTCIGNLEAINSATLLWAIDTKRPLSAPVTWADLQPYLIGDEKCPSGGTTLDDSYVITHVATLPTCQREPATHVLP